jgi:hypothetical protein
MNFARMKKLATLDPEAMNAALAPLPDQFQH